VCESAQEEFLIEIKKEVFEMATGTAVAPMRAFRDLMTAEPFRALQTMNRLVEEAFGSGGFTGEENLSLAV
jgi:hypothetical protein